MEYCQDDDDFGFVVFIKITRLYKIDSFINKKIVLSSTFVKRIINESRQPQLINFLRIFFTCFIKHHILSRKLDVNRIIIITLNDTTYINS